MDSHAQKIFSERRSFDYSKHNQRNQTLSVFFERNGEASSHDITAAALVITSAVGCLRNLRLAVRDLPPSRSAATILQ
jgi:hypothetical protein